MRDRCPVGESSATHLLGSRNLRGPIVTAGGLVFIGATLGKGGELVVYPLPSRR